MFNSTYSRKIFVGCLRCYNEGKIVGEWLDLSDFYCANELHEKATAIVKASPCVGGEEYLIQDSEGFGGLLNGLYPSVYEAWTIYETLKLAEMEGIDPDLFLEFVQHQSYDNLIKKENCIVESFQDSYQGSYNSLEDWAYNFVSETLLCELQGKVKEQVEYFFDYRKYVQDCEYSGDIWHIVFGGNVHVFTSNY